MIGNCCNVVVVKQEFRQKVLLVLTSNVHIFANRGCYRKMEVLCLQSIVQKKSNDKIIHTNIYQYVRRMSNKEKGSKFLGSICNEMSK